VLDQPVPEGAALEVSNADNSLWTDGTVLRTKLDPLRPSQAIHIN